MTDILMGSKYIVLNNNITAEFGISASVMLSSLISRHDYYLKYEKIKNSEDWFYSTVEDIEKDTGLSRFQQAKAIKALMKSGIIESKTEKKPYCLRYFRFTAECMEKLSAVCGKFFSADNSNNLSDQSNNLSCTSEIISHKSINIGNQHNSDDIIQQEKNFFNQIEIDRLTKTDKEFSELIISTVKPIFKTQFARVNRKNMHISAIMKKFSKLTYDHMLEVREKLNKFKNKAINNISAYLITMLYNIADTPKKFLSLYKANKRKFYNKRSYDIEEFEKFAINKDAINEIIAERGTLEPANNINVEDFAINKAALDEIEAEHGTSKPSLEESDETLKSDDETIKTEPAESEIEEPAVNRDDETIKTEPVIEEPEVNRDDEIKQFLKSIEIQISLHKTYDEAIAWLENLCPDWKSCSDRIQVAYIKNQLSWYPDAPAYYNV